MRATDRLCLEAHLHFDVAGIIVFIFDFANEAHFVAVDGHRGRLGQTGNVGVGRIVVVGGLEDIVAFEIFDAEVDHNEGNDYGESD